MGPASFDAVNYKLSAMQNWDTVAHDYHCSWAGVDRGSFKSTAELISAADLKSDDWVLDVACGTGAVSIEAMQRLGPRGTLVGIDFSLVALAIAKASSPSPRAHFLQMDAESIGLCARFDKVLCQYALMFFPNSRRVLSALRNFIKPGGRLVLTVHGTPEGVPYFSTVMEPVIKYIADIRPSGTPTVHRYGTPKDLESELVGAGYNKISIKKLTFYYEAGTFEQYWSDYLATTANSIRNRMESDPQIIHDIKEEARQRALKFTSDDTITFPWDVLLATAEL